MPTLDSVMAELKSKGREQTRKIYVRHGATESRMFGVPVADLKLIAKTIKKDQALACALYETGNVDAMYLAGIVAGGSQMSQKQLEAWARDSDGFSMISEYTVPWVAVESPHARALALKWIKSKIEHVAASGWCTYSGIVATTPDEALDLPEIERLLDVVVREIKGAPDRGRYTMNGFVIAVGTYVAPLLNQAKRAAKAIGTVSVNMGDTACKVPLASASIEKVEAAARVGKKRATIRC
jgi:3-methyladenine DNA glycosylase AlkD